MANFTAEEVRYLVNHLFLPPQLPQQDDSSSSYEDALLRVIQQALGDFIQDLRPEQDEASRLVTASISQFALLQNRNGLLDGLKLAQAFQSLSNVDADITIPIHVRAQNAAVMVNKRGNEIEIEAFELSPTDSAVMGASGRLRRCFPGPSVCIGKDQFSNPGLQSVLTKTLSKLSAHCVSGITNPDFGRSISDTHHPGLVTELLFAFLQPIGRKGTSQRIWKHSREDTLFQYRDGGPPWRRSSLWLLIRVVMQLLFTRQSVGIPDYSAGRDYKLCMLYIFAAVLDQAVALDEPDSLSPDTLHCMSSKIVRRMLKLDIRHEEPGITFVQSVLQKTNMHLERKWALIRQRNQGDLDLSSLPRLKFINDVSIALPNLDEFLSSLFAREPAQHGVDVAITPGLQHFYPNNFPVLDASFPVEFLPYNLERFETWVASHLRDWHRRAWSKSNARLCFGNAMNIYYTKAKDLYSGNPEATSVMILTLLELWVRCDKMAIHDFPLLRDYDPEVPTSVLQCLLLRTKDHMSRLQSVERYITRRRSMAKLSAMSFIFQGFGTAESFSVRYYDQSVSLQHSHRAIEYAANKERSAKLTELERAKKEYDRLMTLYDTASPCQTVLQTSRYRRGRKWFEEETRVHKGPGPCARCSYKREAKAMMIDIFEWPLPSDPFEAKSVIFELDVPKAFSSWRDSTTFLLMEVLGQEYGVCNTAKSTCTKQR